jgi:predicted metal-binding membrane protein
MAALFVVGAMDRAAMAVVTVAITLERVSPAGEHVAHGIGFVIVVVGVWLTAKAAGIV